MSKALDVNTQPIQTDGGDILKKEDVIEIEQAEYHPRYMEAGDVLQAPVIETNYARLSRWQTFKLFWKPVSICLAVNWAAVNDAFQGQLPGNIIANPAFIQTMADTTVNGKLTIRATHVSLWGGLGSVGQTLGQGTGGAISDYLGRKLILLLVSILFLGASFISIFAQDWQMWLGAKILGQFAVGAATSTILTYISEMSPFQLRGTLVGSYQFFVGLGQMLVSVALLIVNETEPKSWRPAIASEFVFTGIFLVILPFLPESHFYYARRDKPEQAKKVMQRVYGYVEGYDVDHEYAVIERGIEEERAFQTSASQAKWSELFSGTNGRRTLVGIFAQLAQAFAGSSIFFNYSTYFFTNAGLNNAPLISVVVFLVLIIFCVFGLFLTEKIGRRPLLLGGCMMMFLFNLGLAASGYSTSPSAASASLAMIILWAMTYGISAAPIGFVSAAETSTPRLRGAGLRFFGRPGRFSYDGGLHLGRARLVPNHIRRSEEKTGGRGLTGNRREYVCGVVTRSPICLALLRTDQSGPSWWGSNPPTIVF